VIIYSIFDSEHSEGSSYFATLAEARQARDEWYGGDAEIEKLWLVDLPPKKLAVRLLSGEGFVARREVVK
jgi:hypothetical protein